MSGEVSYFSRFFVKFVEIIAAGLASAIGAYLLAYFGGVLLSSPTPAFAPVAPTVSDVAESLRAQPTPPVVAPTVNDRRPAPQQDTDAPAAQRAPQVGKDAKPLPARRRTKTNASIVEKEPRDQKSAEALVRDALANVDANRPASADAPIGLGRTDTSSAPVDVQLPEAGVRPRQANESWPADLPPRPAATKPAPRAADIPAQPVQPPPATAPDLQPRFPDLPATVDLVPRSISPPQIAAPQPSPADRDNDVFSALTRLRPDPPPTTGEAPRPPMPIGTE
jgi:hypothetical protein